MNRVDKASARTCWHRRASPGRRTHAGNELLRRHMHVEGFFAVVLAGSYVEAGDTGRHRAMPGDVIVHRPYEHHLDLFSSRGAEVLILPLLDRWPKTIFARVDDADAIVRMAASDIGAASRLVAGTMVEKAPIVEDWPDLLARDLLADPDLSLSAWADRTGVHRGSLARGFRRQFDISPASYRSVVRARRAIEDVVSGYARLSAIAADRGFADQAHMSRAIKGITGHPPHRLRQLFLA